MGKKVSEIPVRVAVKDVEVDANLDSNLGEVLLVTPYLGFGDLLYHTPLIRMLSNTYDGGVDVWCLNPEPLQNNPYIKNLFTMEGKESPNPWDFYFDNVFHMSMDHNQKYEDLRMTNIHMVDYVTLGTLNLILRDHEKYLTLNWSHEDEHKVRSLLENENVITNESEDSNLVIVNPSITWPSRTLPLDYYKELIARIQDNGDKVVLVGKEINPSGFLPDMYDSDEEKKLKRDETKTMYPAENFPGTINLIDKLSLMECAALYSMAKLAINTENGNLVISGTNAKCWNVYIPTLTAPEFRVPFRCGSQDHKTVVVKNANNYYPSSDYKLKRGHYDTITVPVELPTIDLIYDGYLQANQLFKVQCFLEKDEPVIVKKDGSYYYSGRN